MHLLRVTVNKRADKYAVWKSITTQMFLSSVPNIFMYNIYNVYVYIGPDYNLIIWMGWGSFTQNNLGKLGTLWPLSTCGSRLWSIT